MPLLPQTGSDGSAIDFRHASSRDNVLLFSHAPFANDAHHAFADGVTLLESRNLANDYNATVVMMAHQRQVIQIVASTMATVSLFSALLAVYWFCMMRRNFRRDLVLLLILAGSWKSLWFVIFSATSFVHGMIPTESRFCQASGYLLLVGFQSCDLAILFMSMHMCLQIFPHTRGPFGHDGLYPVRKWVIAVWILIPNLSASLAFVGEHGGYVGQGAFCFLPLRPFWYRLALYWVPRYLIWCYITYVAIRIYRHVGAEFKVFGQERDRSSSTGMPGQSSVDRAQKREELKRRASQGTNSIEKHALHADVESCAPDDISAANAGVLPPVDDAEFTGDPAKERADTLSWSLNALGPDSIHNVSPSRSVPGSRRGSKQLAPGIFSEDFAPIAESSRQRPSITSFNSTRSAPRASLVDNSLSPINEGLPSHSPPARPQPDQKTADRTLDLRRRAIQRQLRLLFIYPCTYLILWIIPFVVHCMNYTEYFAHHPIFGLNVTQTFCLTVMTFVDVIVFCWREKPWRHIPGSDGTFLGSLAWWRYAFDGECSRLRRKVRAPSFGRSSLEEKDAETTNGTSSSNSGLLASLKRWCMSLKGGSQRGSESSETASPPSQRTSVPHKRNYSGGSDRKHMEADRARERLMLERAEYEQNRRSLQERRESALSEQNQQAGERRDWFDRDLER